MKECVHLEHPESYSPDAERLKSLHNYDSDRFGPLFAVSDDGSAGPVVVEAMWLSAKMRVFGYGDPILLGAALDGERMTSAGEVPIGPLEYEQLIESARKYLFLTTNVGVRANARFTQQLPEFPLPGESGDEESRIRQVCDAFSPFVHTPDNHPRPLTVRLQVGPDVSADSVKRFVAKLEAARQKGQIGPSTIHRFAVLAVFNKELASADVPKLEELVEITADSGLDELTLDAELRPAARAHLVVQSLLNILEPDDLRALLAVAHRKGIRLSYRYQLDVDSAVRTIWTGLYTARAQGFSAGKYGLLPMTLEEQAAVVEMITRWTADWCAVPAFYVDTPLLTADNVYMQSECKEAAKRWLTMARGAGAKLVLFDSPDRVSPKKLVRLQQSDLEGVLTLDEVDEILVHARELGVSILWSGGISSRQAYELAKRKVAGIFCTSSTAHKIAVLADFERDPRLAAEKEPTELGVRRIHALIQGGFLSSMLADVPLAQSIAKASESLLAAESDPVTASDELKRLNESLVLGWRALFGTEKKLKPETLGPFDIPTPVPADSVRVFLGRRNKNFVHTRFVEKLGTVFMPLTVQMQRQYGLTAYLPAVLPESKPGGLPDEIALVFYRTQASYQEAKRCVGGRAYSELHELVFEMAESVSAFPRLFTDDAVPGVPYQLLNRSVDWQIGVCRLFVGVRREGVKSEEFRRAVAEAATNVQRTSGQLDGVIFYTTDDWLVCWDHSSETIPEENNRFDGVADKIYAAVSQARRMPVSLLRPFLGVSINPAGEFLNFQFPRP